MFYPGFVGELSGGTISGTSQDGVLAVPAIRTSIGVDPGESTIRIRTPCDFLGDKVNQCTYMIGFESADS